MRAGTMSHFLLGFQDVLLINTPLYSRRNQLDREQLLKDALDIPKKRGYRFPRGEPANFTRGRSVCQRKGICLPLLELKKPEQSSSPPRAVPEIFDRLGKKSERPGMAGGNTAAQSRYSIPEDVLYSPSSFSRSRTRAGRSRWSSGTLPRGAPESATWNSFDLELHCDN